MMPLGNRRHQEPRRHPPAHHQHRPHRPDLGRSHRSTHRLAARTAPQQRAGRLSSPTTSCSVPRTGPGGGWAGWCSRTADWSGYRPRPGSSPTAAPTNHSAALTSRGCAPCPEPTSGSATDISRQLLAHPNSKKVQVTDLDLRIGGADGTRTRDPRTASAVRYQLRYSPEEITTDRPWRRSPYTRSAVISTQDQFNAGRR